MISREPTIERLAIARALLLEPFGLDEAKLALSFFAAAKANVWSPSNPKGTKIAMLMLEDPKAI